MSGNLTGDRVEYDYDPMGRWAKKSGALVSTENKFLHDGVEEIADYDSSGALLRRYVHGPGVDEYLVMYTVSGTSSKSYFHANHQGSIIAMTDASGNVTEQHSYDAYGNSDDLTGNPFRYTGRRLDEETGLYYYRARYYSPAIGRFLQTDPIGYGDGLNWYAYVQNDPVNNIDPMGNTTCETSDDSPCLFQPEIDPPSEDDDDGDEGDDSAGSITGNVAAFAMGISGSQNSGAGGSKTTYKMVSRQGVSQQKGKFDRMIVGSYGRFAKMLGMAIDFGEEEYQLDGKISFTYTFPFPIGTTGVFQGQPNKLSWTIKVIVNPAWTNHAQIVKDFGPSTIPIHNAFPVR